jgi:hypothetical protein
MFAVLLLMMQQQLAVVTNPGSTADFITQYQAQQNDRLAATAQIVGLFINRNLILIDNCSSKIA